MTFSLPIAIMAHNEATVIARSILSALNQIPPVGYSITVLVVANGCTDNTEEIVSKLQSRHPSQLCLISLKEKGKTRAINKAISFFDQLVCAGAIIPYVIFLDADCEFIGNHICQNIITRFDANPLLKAVSATCVPDVLFNSRTDLVARLYTAVYSTSSHLKTNSISGMCYAIRYEILQQIDFPQFQFAEDMFLSSRLNGWFYRDRNVNISFTTPTSFLTEIKRRARQEVSSQRYMQYYAFLKQKGITVELFDGSLGPNYRWRITRHKTLFRAWCSLKDFRLRAYAILYSLILFLAKIIAFRKIRILKKNESLDYWIVKRP